MSFDAAFQHTVGVEGKYSNNPNDPGGETKFGITVATARLYGYKGRMIDLDLATARTIYKAMIWDLLHLGDLDAISPTLSMEVFDSAVNLGTGTPIPWLQRWLNALNRQAVDYPDMPVDGHFGPGTANALRAFLSKRGARGEKVLVAALNCEQGVRYRTIAEGRPQSEDFLFGWMADRVLGS